MDTEWVRRVAPLWPGASVMWAPGRTRRPHADPRVFREFAFLPNAERPRLLLPAGAPAAAAAALHRYSHSLGLKQRVGRNLLARALRTGAPERLLPDRLHVSVPASAGQAPDSIETHLSEILGRDVVISVHLGNPRINRKPVLHALAASGETLAFVKVGDNELTRALVHDEAAALTFLDSYSLRHIDAPRLIHYDSWHDLDLLVQSPLVTTGRRWQGRDTMPLGGMRELAGLGAADPVRLDESDFWRTLAGDSREPARTATGVSRQVRRATQLIGERYGDVSLSMGRWHGDWTPWNMAWRADTVQLWDWERSGFAAPVGFDALHYRLQDAARSAGELNGSVLDAWLAEVPATLESFGVTGRAASATAACYLLSLYWRYVPGHEALDRAGNQDVVLATYVIRRAELF